MKDDLKERMVRRAAAGIAADGPDGCRDLHDVGNVLLAGMGEAVGRGDYGCDVAGADGVRVRMMGWICCCIAWLKELRRKMREAAERQRNYWDGDGQ